MSDSPIDVPPLAIRKLRAAMELKGLSLKAVSALSEVNYNTCCLILKGRLVHPENLTRIREAIKSAPSPQEVA